MVSSAPKKDAREGQVDIALQDSHIRLYAIAEDNEKQTEVLRPRSRAATTKWKNSARHSGNRDLHAKNAMLETWASALRKPVIMNTPPNNASPSPNTNSPADASRLKDLSKNGPQRSGKTGTRKCAKKAQQKSCTTGSEQQGRGLTFPYKNRFRVESDTVWIELSKGGGLETIIDLEFWPEVQKHEWFLEQSTGRNYAATFMTDEAGFRHLVYLHDFILFLSSLELLHDFSGIANGQNSEEARL